MLACVTQERTDEELMTLYSGGDYSAFEALYQRHRSPLMRYLLRQLHNQAIAEELFQEIWVKVINARERYQASALFRTYLYHIAHNVLIDHYRKSKPDAKIFDDPQGVEEQVADTRGEPERKLAGQNKVEALLEMIAALPQEQRETFLLKEDAGLSVAEIATATNSRAETVKSRLRYAMAKLRGGLEARYGRF